MNISHFFIDRPIFAAVISILITLVGGIAYFSLPVAQYPDIAPPSIRSPRRIRAPTRNRRRDRCHAHRARGQRRGEHALHDLAIDQRRGMSLAVTFKLGTNLDTAQVLVQNRVAIAQPRLPEEVRVSALPS